MRFAVLLSLGVMFVGLRVLGSDEVVGYNTESGKIGAEIEARYISETSHSLAQPTNADAEIEDTVLSSSSLLLTATATMRAATPASGSDGAMSTGNDFELREIIVHPNPDPSMQGRSQYPTVTTQWVPTILPDGATTYIEIVFTQTFASAPDPLPSPGEGRIGMDDEFGGLVREVKAMSGAANNMKDRKKVIVLGIAFVLVFWGLGSGFAGVIGLQ